MKPERAIRWAEATGVLPIRERWKQALVALRGEEDVPSSRFDTTSLAQLRPRLGLPMWAGRPFLPRTVLITNLFNHEQTPVEEGWSVRRRQMRDFRGRDLTYDSHNGTDFAIPVGTPVLTPAPGKVVRIASEFNRGGLKVFIDHGDNLMTCSVHLARAAVTVGQHLDRGQLIAWSGYSGLDGFSTFPWGVPHVHLNVWLNGEPVDPFAHDGHASMWRAGALPTSPSADEPQAAWEESHYDETGVEQAIQACKTPSSRERLRSVEPLWRRAAEVIAEMNYYPTRFPERPFVYATREERRPTLDLPFSSSMFDRVVFVDDL